MGCAGGGAGLSVRHRRGELDQRRRAAKCEVGAPPGSSAAAALFALRCLPPCSNVFGSALWAADILFNMAAVGVSHWDFHGGPGGWYAAITYANPSALDAPPTVHPLFYGIWLFSDAAANASSLTASSIDSTNPLVVAWATRSSPPTSQVATWKVVVLHKDLAATDNATVTVALPPAFGALASVGATASVRFLSASGGPYATSGVYFGGQTFDGSPDGSVQGQPLLTPVQPDAEGHFVFSIAPLTAAVLTISLPAGPSYYNEKHWQRRII